MKYYFDMKLEILYFTTQDVITSSTSDYVEEADDTAPDFEW